MKKGKLDNKINIEENSFPTTKVVGVEAKVGMPSENSFGQWHFTKDELPELDKSVLCYVEIEDIDGEKYKSLTFGKRFINYTQEPVFVADAGSFSKGEEIICWMYVKDIPLPKL